MLYFAITLVSETRQSLWGFRLNVVSDAHIGFVRYQAMEASYVTTTGMKRTDLMKL